MCVCRRWREYAADGRTKSIMCTFSASHSRRDARLWNAVSRSRPPFDSLQESKNDIQKSRILRSKARVENQKTFYSRRSLGHFSCSTMFSPRRWPALARLASATAGIAFAATATTLRSSSSADYGADTTDLLNTLYSDLPDIHEIPIADIRTIDASGGHQAYGELTVRGVREVQKLLLPTPNDCFVDLGSGAGRCVLQAALEWPCRSAIGVELSESRHLVGIRALARAPPELRARALLLQEDMLTCRKLEEATIVYCASLLFDDAFMARLASRLASLPRVRMIATLTRFPAGTSLDDGFEEDPSNASRSDDPQTLRERVEVTWGAARVYLYRRRGTPGSTQERPPDCTFA